MRFLIIFGYLITLCICSSFIPSLMFTPIKTLNIIGAILFVVVIATFTVLMTIEFLKSNWFNFDTKYMK